MSDPSPMGAYGKALVGRQRTIHCSLLRTSDQSIPNASGTTISFDPATVVDTDAMYSVGSPTRITCVVPGLYHLHGGIYWETNATGYRSLRLLVNNAWVAGSAGPATATINTTHCASVVWPLAVGDYVELRVQQNSGDALSALTIGGAPLLVATWLTGSV